MPEEGEENAGSRRGARERGKRVSKEEEKHEDSIDFTNEIANC